MSGLETFIPSPGTENNYNSEEYEHAAKYFQSKTKLASGKNAEQFARCGTLSKSEWEVTSKFLSVFWFCLHQLKLFFFIIRFFKKD